MANDNNAQNGFLFLVDAQTTRQYAFEIVDDKMKLPMYVFPENQKVKPGETIYAFDEDQVTSVQSNGGFVSTDAYQIEMDATGEHPEITIVNVTYKVTPYRGTDGNPHFALDMTPQSIKELEKEGFGSDFPTHFEKAEFRTSGGLSAALPPQHPNGRANAAHDGISKVMTARGKTPGASAQFNNQAAATAAQKKYKVTDQALEAALTKFCRDLTQLAREHKLDPVIGRDAETDQALKVLTRRKQASLCFTGDAGVGKSAMFSGIAQRLVDDEANLPESLKGARVLELDLQAMNAGSRYRGDFEEKIKPLIDGLAEREGMFNGKKVILAIDEIHAQLTAGAAEGGSSAGNMMKPFLTSKGVSVMGTTTDDEYRKYIEKDPAIASRFEKMRLMSTDEESTVQILKTLWPLTKEHNHLTQDLSEDDIRYIVTMTNRYAPQESQPRKSEKAMNMAAASAEFEHRSTIERKDVIAAVAQMSHLSADFLSQSDADRFLKMEEEIPKQVLGQPGVLKVTDGLIGARSGLNDPNQPWGCFVFQGPTGSGKTELCKALARYLFGNEDALIKLDMAEYSEKHTVSRLIGAPPGYVGFEDAEPALTERIRNQPYSILLLDEIEKADPSVFNVLLPILNDGKMTDSHGKTVLFNNVIVVMTTNAGAEQVQKLVNGNKGIGFNTGGDSAAEEMQEKLEAIYAKARTREGGGPFKPEMINRIEELGGFITFVPPSRDTVAEIATRQVAEVGKRLGKADGANLPNVSLEIAPAAMAQLVDQGYNPAMGLRPMRKVIREKVANPLGKWVMLHKEEVTAFVKENGPAKLVINGIGADFAPELVKDQAAATPSNDNAAKKKKAAGGPKPE